MKIIATSKAPAAIGPYSQGVSVGELVFTSGQLPINMETGELETDIELGTKACLDNIKAILEEAGLGMENIIKTTVFLSDMENFGSMNQVYADYFSSKAPARSTVEVARLPKDALVEIECIASR